MALAKFDSLSIQFSKKIGDTVATSSAAGTILTVAERETYINLALNEVFRKYWAGVQGDSDKFLEIFPELFRSVQATVTTGVYTLAAATTYDFFKMIDAYTTSTPKYIKFLKKSLRTVVIAETNTLYVPSATNLIGFEVEGTLEFYPVASFPSTSVELNYIRKPVDPANGLAYTYSSTTDIPFNAIWSEEIAETALQIWRQNTQERN